MYNGLQLFTETSSFKKFSGQYGSYGSYMDASFTTKYCYNIINKAIEYLESLLSASKFGPLNPLNLYYINTLYNNLTWTYEKYSFHGLSSLTAICEVAYLSIFHITHDIYELEYPKQMHNMFKKINKSLFILKNTLKDKNLETLNDMEFEKNKIVIRISNKYIKINLLLDLLKLDLATLKETFGRNIFNHYKIPLSIPFHDIMLKKAIRIKTKIENAKSLKKARSLACSLKFKR